MVWAVPKGTTASRGYGTPHTKARAQAAKQHRDSDPCARCGHPLGPMGPWLHYDHTDRRDGYLGFSHRRCNIKAGARKGARVRNRRAKIKTMLDDSRRW
jgi:hypothetical protein